MHGCGATDAQAQVVAEAIAPFGPVPPLASPNFLNLADLPAALGAARVMGAYSVGREGLRQRSANPQHTLYQLSVAVLCSRARAICVP